jgi:hypothetical protein
VSPAGAPLAVDDLTDDEIAELLDMVEEFDPIIVGGQAVNLWVQYYRAKDGSFFGERPFTSKDLDFYANPLAAERLAVGLGGKLFIPYPGDATPNAAWVVGRLHGKLIEVDFLTSILGVEGWRITNNHVVIGGHVPTSGRQIRLLLLHPLDCLRSRLANINQLGRGDDHSIRQATAAAAVLGRFLGDVLDDSKRLRHVQTVLVELSYVVRNLHAGKNSHLRHGLEPERILDEFQDDKRLDARWRDLILRPCRARVARWLEKAEGRVPF